MVTQRIMFNLDGRKQVGINLRGKLRFQQAISFVLANLAGTSWPELQRCLKEDYYLTKQMASVYNRIQSQKSLKFSDLIEEMAAV